MDKMWKVTNRGLSTKKTIEHYSGQNTRGLKTLAFCLKPAVSNTYTFAQIFLDTEGVHWLTQNATLYMRCK